MSSHISPNLRRITNGESALIYDCKTGQNLILNKGALTVLELLSSGMSVDEIKDKYDAPAIDQLAETLVAKKLIILDGDVPPSCKVQHVSDKEIEDGSLLQHLRLNITEKCNLDCSYCFERVSNVYANKRVMTWEVAKKAIDEFMLWISKNKQSNVSIRFFGGEPLLNWDLAERCIKYAKETAPTETNVNFIFNTNGVLINDEIAKVLAENNISISLSLDGVGEYHDKTRKFINGTGSFDIIDKKIEILARNKCMFNLSVVCSDINFPHMRELIDYIQKKQDEIQYRISVCFNNIQICSRSGIDTYSTAQKVGFLIDTLKYSREKGVYSFGGLTHFVFEKLLKGFDGSYCAGTGREISIDPDGCIFPCSGQEILLGTLDKFEEIFRSENYKSLTKRRAGNIDNCNGCEIEGFCAGGCLAELMSESGKSKGEYRDCDLQKLTFSELVKQYILTT